MNICSQNEIICCILNLLKSLRLLLDPITNLCLHWEMANHMKMKFEWLCCFGLFHDDQKRGKRASFYDINLHYFESGYMTLRDIIQYHHSYLTQHIYAHGHHFFVYHITLECMIIRKVITITRSITITIRIGKVGHDYSVTI